jgi:GNAT superfamily N-acetyltransferase
LPGSTRCHCTASRSPNWRRAAVASCRAIPAFRLIGWLGLDAGFRGQHVGSMLLADAIMRLAAAAVGIHAICADAIDDAALTFYRELSLFCFGFRWPRACRRERRPSTALKRRANCRPHSTVQ